MQEQKQISLAESIILRRRNQLTSLGETKSLQHSSGGLRCQVEKNNKIVSAISAPIISESNNFNFQDSNLFYNKRMASLPKASKTSHFYYARERDESKDRTNKTFQAKNNQNYQNTIKKLEMLKAMNSKSDDLDQLNYMLSPEETSRLEAEQRREKERQRKENEHREKEMKVKIEPIKHFKRKIIRIIKIQLKNLKC
jgi:hypothetical protein